MSKRTPEETLAALEEWEADDEMERVLAMTPEERRAELRAAGFDLDAVHARADALYAAAPAPTRAVTELRRRRPLRLGLLAAAALALAIVGVTLFPRDPHVGAGNPRAVWEAEAAARRREAAAACEAKDLAVCADRLEEARVLDPEGDKSPEARAIHDQIAALKRTP